MSEAMLGTTGGGSSSGLWATIRRLYRDDALWRGAVDTAAIGAVVMVLAAPSLRLPLPSWGGGGPSPSATYQAPVDPPVPPLSLLDPDIAQVAQQARSGDAVSQLLLAQALRWGRGAPMLKDQAVHWFRRAAEAGNVDAMVELADMTRQGEAGAADVAEARRWYRAAADKGDRRAQRALAEMLDAGQGGAADAQAATALFSQAALAGDLAAQAALGRRLLDGQGVAADPFAAAFWLELAQADGASGLAEALKRAEAGLNEAERAAVTSAVRGWQPGQPLPARPAAAAVDPGQIVVADLLQRFGWKHEAASLLRAMAEAGLPRAMYGYGLMLAEGRGVPRAAAAANDWWERAAAKGDAKAQTALVTARSARRELSEAEVLETLQPAAASGDIHARLALGLYLADNGTGAPRDAARAYQTLLGVQDMAMPEAWSELGRLTELGFAPASQQAIQASDWYLKAADAGHAQALYALARIIQERSKAESAKEDRDSALSLLIMAADRNHMMAKTELARFPEREVAALRAKLPKFKPGSLMEKTLRTRGDPQAKQRFKAAADFLDAGDDRRAHEELIRLSKDDWAEAWNALGVMAQQGKTQNASPAALYRRAMERGAPEAADNLARLYMVGTTEVPRDLNLAYVLLWRAAGMGDTMALVDLARLYRLPDYPWHSDVAAHALLAHAARAGENAAQAPLAEVEAALTSAQRAQSLDLQTKMSSTPPKMVSADEQDRLAKESQRLWAAKDYAKAVAIIRDLAAMGNPEGMDTLAQCYFEGWEVPRDMTQSAVWAAKAAAHGQPYSHWLLGVFSEAGAGGLEKSLPAAARYYRFAAEGGIDTAAQRLGLFYEQGTAMAQDHAQAAKWYRRAAEAGNIPAAAALGRLLQAGQGVVRDYEEAGRWYRKAAEGGDMTGMYGLAVLAHGGLGMPQDPVAAARWATGAAKRGHGAARAMLGRLYRDGDGVARDLVEAYAWLSAAENSGEMSAAADRQAVAAQLTGAQLDLASRRGEAYAEKVK